MSNTENEIAVATGEGAEAQRVIVKLAPLTLGSIRKGGLLKHIGSLSSLRSIGEILEKPDLVSPENAERVAVAMNAMMAVVVISAGIADPSQTPEKTELLFDSLGLKTGPLILGEAFKKVMALSNFDKIEAVSDAGGVGPKS